jgi:hypothetical protein
MPRRGRVASAELDETSILTPSRLRVAGAHITAQILALADRQVNSDTG